MHVHGILVWIVLIAGALSGAIYIWHKAVRPIVRGAEVLAAVLTPDEYTGLTVMDRMAIIEKRTEQLEPNGGNSLYDRVGKLETGQKAMSARITTTNKRLTVVSEGLAPMAKAIGILAGPPRRTVRGK